jgi:hypothetical protein
MRVLKLTSEKINFLQIFLQFLFFSVKRPDRLKRGDGHVTRSNARGLVTCLCGITRPDRLVMRPDGVLTGLHIAFQP